MSCRAAQVHAKAAGRFSLYCLRQAEGVTDTGMVDGEQI